MNVMNILVKLLIKLSIVYDEKDEMESLFCVKFCNKKAMTDVLGEY
jgi:hypothetical protein